MLPGGSAEYIMPMMALSNLPPVLSGLILAGATAAIMSTASALLLVIGSSVGNDLLTMIHPEASEEHKMKITRWSTYLLGLVSCAMCFVPLFSVGVYQLTWIAWSVLSPAFIPCIIGGLYWKNATKGGAIAAICYGVRLVLPAAGDHKYPHIFRSSGSGYRSLYHRQKKKKKASSGSSGSLLLCKEL